MFAAGVSLGVMGFTFIFLAAIGAEPTLLGVSVAVNAVAEAIYMFFSSAQNY